MPRRRATSKDSNMEPTPEESETAFEVYKKQGESLGLSGKELIEYIDKKESADERVAQREAEERVAQREAEERERVAKREAEERERVSQREAKEREAERNYELECRRISSEAEICRERIRDENPHVARSRDSNQPKVKMPYLEDKEDVEAYLTQFERVATLNKWDRAEWGIRLVPLLKGESRDAYVQLPVAESSNYEKIKATILKRHQLNAVAYRKNFRNARPKDGEEHFAYWDRLNLMLTRWIEMSGKEETDLKDMLVLERFLETQTLEKARFIRERKPKDRQETVDAADLFEETRMAEKRYVNGKLLDAKPKDKSFNQQRSQNPPSASDNAANNGTNAQGMRSFSRRGPPTFGQQRQKGCFKCGGDHFIKSCPKREDISVFIGEPTEVDNILTFTRTAKEPQDSRYVCTVRIEGQEAKALRDTGATQSQVHKKLVPKQCYTGRFKTVVYGNNARERLPTAVVNMESPYFVGQVEVLVAEETPVPVLIGNTGPKQPLDHTAKTHTDVEIKEPHCSVQAITAGQGENKPNKTQCEPSTSSEQNEPSTSAAHDKPTKSAEIDKPSTSTAPCKDKDQTLSTKVHAPPPIKVKQSALADITPQQLREDQKDDQTIKRIYEQAKTKPRKTIRRDGTITEYYFKRGVLYRKYRKQDKTLNQVIVPKKFRTGILEIAHDTPMAGHMGMKRTQERITNAFYWPGIDGDVRRYCLSCDACQRSMDKGRHRRAPLQEVPIVHEPFQQVAIDLIGPISPTTSKGNRYVLTMIDYATKYAEAIAIPRVDTITVAEALWEMWSRLGIPEKVISDRGTQFTSDVMKEIFRLLSIKGAVTTPYHAQANGLVEKFNGTLKNMIRRLCIEQPHEWDRVLPAMLFAYREVPQESTGYSPFELLYGRNVRGPLDVLKKCWTNEEEDNEVRTAAEYVTELKNRVEMSCRIAAEHQRAARSRYARTYNRKAVARTLEPGEKVLVLLPDKHKRLQLSWQGPFEVKRQTSRVDYVILIKGKEKLYHLNLVKKYIEREEQTERISVVVHEDHEMEISTGSEIPLFPLKQTENYTDVRYAPTLPAEKIRQLQQVVEKHQEALSDLPGHTKIEECSIKLDTTKPVRVAQYPIPHSQLETVKKEVKEMEALGVIERKMSPYNAPIVLVKKKNNQIRFCTDYRRLNAATEFDPEPMPNVDAIFAKLGKAKYFSKFDATKGFWQIPMKEEDKEKTAFTTPSGQYVWTRMPFGMKNASAVFSRMMRKLLEPLDRCDIHNFIDDILVGSEEWEEHVRSVDLILGRIQDAGLTIKPSKCYLGYEELSFLGHELASGTVRPETDKIEKLQKAERPCTKQNVRAFLGLAGYYRKFIPNFAETAMPLTDATKKGKPEVIKWDDHCEQAFQTLKRELGSKPIMVLPDCSKQYVLRTDASSRGLGAVLLQERDGDLRPVAYSSKKLTKTEENYSTIEKECLGVIWAIRKFEPYLFGSHFILETDHRPLEYLRRSKTDNGRLMRWALQLQQHSFSLRVIPGKDNIGADYMSRLE